MIDATNGNVSNVGFYGKDLSGIKEIKTKKPEIGSIFNQPGFKEKIKELIENKQIQEAVQNGGELKYGIEVTRSKNGTAHASKPDTMEYKFHDISQKIDEKSWLKEHPEPKNSFMHKLWENAKQKHSEEFESNYRANHESYAEQADYYAKVKHECLENNVKQILPKVLPKVIK